MHTPTAHSRPEVSRREQVLALLEETHGWCSGEMLSERLGVSRAAVAKHIAALRGQGHGIASAPRRGHRLLVKKDAITAESVQTLLSTHTLGRAEWRCLEETSSTNREAIILAAEGASEGSVIIAEHQTQGRGRKGRAWFSAPRGIQCSLILRPALEESQIPLLTTLAVVAVAEALTRRTALAPRIKSPNDVYINGRKVCGVLAEVGLQAGEVDWAVLGIGCNVNALEQELSAELRPLITSLLIETGEPVSRPALLAAILERVECWSDRLREEGSEPLQARWKELGGTL